MAKYTYKIEIYDLDVDGPLDERKLGEATGEVEAERYSHACGEAWLLINEQCQQIEQEHEHRIGVGDLHVELKSE